MALVIIGAIIAAFVLVIVILKIKSDAEWKASQKKEEEYLSKAGQGNPQTQFSLGLLYKKEDWSAQYTCQAIYWLQKAANQGINGARSELDDCKKKLDERFKTLEESIKSFNNYQIIKEFRVELAKKGYLFGDSYFEKNITPLENCHRITIDVISINDAECKKLGYIEFGTHTHERANRNDSLVKYHSERGYGYGKHMIQLDKASILIRSEIPSSEAPPEWMMICAMLIADFSTISYPQWVEENPDAKEYVNVAFKKLGSCSEAEVSEQL